MSKARGFGRGISKRSTNEGSVEKDITSIERPASLCSINQPNSNIVEPPNHVNQSCQNINHTVLNRGRGRSRNVVRHLAQNEHRTPSNQEDIDPSTKPIVQHQEESCSTPNGRVVGPHNVPQCGNPKNRVLGRTRFSNQSISTLNKSMERFDVSPKAKSNRPSGGQRCFNFSYQEPCVKESTAPQPMELRYLEEGKHVLNSQTDGVVVYKKLFYEKSRADKMLHLLLNTLNFETASVKRGDQVIKQPRMCVWFGPKDVPYNYSFAKLFAHQFESNSVMSKIKADVEDYYKCTFNSCLVNLYRDNKDHVSWHADDEVSLGSKPTIASLSFGETRRFQLCRKSDKDRTPLFGFHLEHGSALLMKGDVQEEWLHCVPREYHDRSLRVNLTFRTIYKVEGQLFEKSERT